MPAGWQGYWVQFTNNYVKLVLAYAALRCVMLSYATFTSVVMGSGPGESCGGPTTSYTTSGSLPFLRVEHGQPLPLQLLLSEKQQREEELPVAIPQQVQLC